jgi:protein TonB
MINNQPAKRFSASLIVAIVIHVIALLAVGFSWAASHTSSNTIEVTLAQYAAPQPIDEADFFAQIDQQGSGEASDKKQLAEQQIFAPNPADISQLEQASATSQPLATEQNQTEQSEPITSFDVIVSQQSSVSIVAQNINDESESQQVPSKTAELSEQIASLRSVINTRQEEMTRAPKKRTISTVSSKSHQDAEYLENWRRKIVTVGNNHYPKAANEQKIYGRVRLLIAMKADGNIKSIEILESSGKKILDHSAIKIIQLSAPFQPFSAQMRKNTDILEIIRTIEF